MNTEKDQKTSSEGARSLQNVIHAARTANAAALMKKWWFLILFLLYALAAILLLPRCSAPETGPEEELRAAAPAASPAVETIVPTPTPAPKEPVFTQATLAYAGDLVIHMGLNEEAKTADGYDFKPMLECVMPYVQPADYAFACLETTFPVEGDVTGYPTFHSPRALAADLKAVGFDLMEMASNHCMDARKEGLDETLNVLDAVGLEHIGTYRTQAERDENHGLVVKELNGISIAFLDYTYGTNCFPVTDFPYATNLFFRDYLEMDCADIDELDFTQLDEDLAYARSLNTDFIVAFMHWGLEYHTEPVDYQYQVADHLFEQGVDLILGGHPHVPEPMEVRRVTDLEGNERTGYLCYCMGNFLSCMNDHYTNLTAVATLELEKNQTTGEAYLKNVSYAPMIMVDTADHGIWTDAFRYRLVDLHKAMDSYAAGDNLGYINETLYQNMQTALNDIHSIFGARLDQYDPAYTPNTEGEMPVPADKPAAE